MGTTYNVKVVPGQKTIDKQQLADEIDALLLDINQAMSTYVPDSEISLVNSAPLNSWLNVSDAFCELLEASGKVHAQSGGAFDVTVGPLVNLWGFGPKKVSESPTQKELEGVMALVGYAYLERDCDANTVRKLNDIYIDFSAIAKGYAADRVADVVSTYEPSGAMVEIGGELTLKGLNPDGEKWRIAVEKPQLLRSQASATQVLSVSNVSVATSGDYRNFYELDGKKVSHSIDPNTGKSITHNLASVTVVHQDGALADAWATAFNVLGDEKGFELASKLNLAAYFIVRGSEHFSVKYTPAFEEYMVIP